MAKKAFGSKFDEEITKQNQDAETIQKLQENKKIRDKKNKSK